MTSRFLTDTKTSPWLLMVLGVASIIALTVSARIQIPMIPVPMTLQTSVVLLLPFLLGARAALATICAYLTLGFAGLPVFAAGAGPAYLLGPTGGYLLGFVAAVLVLSWALDWAKTPVRGLVLMLVGHVVILTCGAAWLAFGVPGQGLAAAFAAGVAPFILGSIIKSALNTMVLAWPRKS